MISSVPNFGRSVPHWRHRITVRDRISRVIPFVREPGQIMAGT
jgi:hypothetical protein